jgi:predicted methyltransferase
MKSVFKLSSIVLLATLTACTSTAELKSQAISDALASPDRNEKAKERDLRSKPEVILDLLDLAKGETAVDILGGGGYYTDLMADVVGEEGMVILQNNGSYNKFVKKILKEKYIDNKVANISLLSSEVDDLKLTPNSIDAALMVMSYHDLYFYDPKRGWGHTDVASFFQQIHTALKPGGRLVIVDHSAKDGTGSSAAQTIHRIDQAFAIKDIESSGFTFVSSSDALANPADDRSKMVFDKSIRGKTDRFVLQFTR